MKKQNYDIFISYRRDGGFEMARLLSDRLTQKGYSVFFDVDAMRGGPFNEQIYEKIDSCQNVILILSKGALDRCKNEDDWVRKEITYAIEKNKLVVPVLLSGFVFPEQDALPKELQPLIYFQSLCPDVNLFDESIEKLCSKYLTVKSHRKVKKYLVVCVATLMIVAIIGLFLSGLLPFGKNSKTYSAELATAVDTACVYAVGQVNNSGSAVLEAIDHCREYINGDIDEETLADYCELEKKVVDDNYALSIDDATMQKAEEVNLCKDALETAEECYVFKQYIEFARNLAMMTTIDNTKKNSALDSLEEIIKLNYIIVLDEAYGAVWPILNDSESKATSEMNNYIFNSNTPTELSGTVNDSLFGQLHEFKDSADIDEDIKSLISTIKGTIKDCDDNIGSIAGSLWSEIK